MGGGDPPAERSQRVRHLVLGDQLDLAAVLGDQAGEEGRRLGGVELRGQAPQLAGNEGGDLPLAVAEDPQGDALHPAGGEAAADLVPQERADLVADQAVQDPAGLLRVHLVGVDLQGVLKGVHDRALGDLVEEDAVKGGIGLPPQLLRQVPGDRLPLAVRVRGQVDGGGALGGLLQLGEGLLLFREGLVGRGEGPLVHPQGLLGEVAHVSHGGLHRVVRPQELVDGLRLGRRLHDHERSCHGG